MSEFKVGERVTYYQKQGYNNKQPMITGIVTSIRGGVVYMRYDNQDIKSQGQAVDKGRLKHGG